MCAFTTVCPNCQKTVSFDENWEYGFCFNCGTKIAVRGQAGAPSATAPFEPRAQTEPVVTLVFDDSITWSIDISLDGTIVATSGGNQSVVLPVKLHSGEHDLLLRGRITEKFPIDTGRPMRMIIGANKGLFAPPYYTIRTEYL